MRVIHIHIISTIVNDESNYTTNDTSIDHEDGCQLNEDSVSKTDISYRKIHFDTKDKPIFDLLDGILKDVYSNAGKVIMNLAQTLEIEKVEKVQKMIHKWIYWSDDDIPFKYSMEFTSVTEM